MEYFLYKTQVIKAVDKPAAINTFSEIHRNSGTITLHDIKINTMQTTIDHYVDYLETKILKMYITLKDTKTIIDKQIAQHYD